MILLALLGCISTFCLFDLARVDGVDLALFGAIRSVNIIGSLRVFLGDRGGGFGRCLAVGDLVTSSDAVALGLGSKGGSVVDHDGSMGCDRADRAVESRYDLFGFGSEAAVTVVFRSILETGTAVILNHFQRPAIFRLVLVLSSTSMLSSLLTYVSLACGPVWDGNRPSANDLWGNAD